VKKGSITIFSVLSMLLVAALLCTLLEGARYHELKRLSKLQTHLALESVFAGYNRYLWEEYHLLAVNRENVEEALYLAGGGRVAEKSLGLNVLGFQVSGVEEKGYTLLTDGKGAAYIHTVSTYMKENFVYEAAASVYEQYEQVQELLENCEWDISKITEALEGLEEANTNLSSKDAVLEDKKLSSLKEDSDVKRIESLLKGVKEALDKGILTLVIQDTASLSNKEIDLTESVSKRLLQEGKNSRIEETEWLDRVLLQQYFLNYMSSYCNEKDGRALTYELEYLLGGKPSDKENMQVLVSQLLALRGAINLTYLLSDTAKVQEVSLLAAAVAGASLNPVFVELVKMALLTAWALAEAVLDVRAILDGKQIALLKNRDLWTLDLEDIGSMANGYAMAKSSTAGADYKEYLGMLLFFQEETELAMRGMSVQEAAVRKEKELQEFKMDSLMVWTDVEIRYKVSPLFPSFGTNFWREEWAYELYTREEFGYW